MGRHWYLDAFQPEHPMVGHGGTVLAERIRGRCIVGELKRFSVFLTGLPCAVNVFLHLIDFRLSGRGRRGAVHGHELATHVFNPFLRADKIRVSCWADRRSAAFTQRGQRVQGRQQAAHFIPGELCFSAGSVFFCYEKSRIICICRHRDSSFWRVLYTIKTVYRIRRIALFSEKWKGLPVCFGRLPCRTSGPVRSIRTGFRG